MTPLKRARLRRVLPAPQEVLLPLKSPALLLPSLKLSKSLLQLKVLLLPRFKLKKKALLPQELVA